MDTSALKFSGLAACILAIVAALACGPVAPPAQTPGGSQSTPMPTATSSNRLPPAVAESRLVELLDKVPLSLKERGIWFGDNERALELAGAPQPRSPDEVRALNEAQREGYLNALGNVVQAAGFGRFRGQLQERNETFGLNYFGIARGVRTGRDSTHPHELAYVEGNFDPATVQQMLLALGYESLETVGLAYYAAPQGFHKLENPASRLSLSSSMDHVFIGDGVLMAAKASDMLTDALKVRAGAALSMADDPPVLGIASSLEDPLSAVILTRLSVLEPGYLPALFYDKPTDWGTLNEWELFAAGYGVSGTDRLLTVSLYYADPNHAAEDAGELERRIQGYVTIVPQLLPGASPELAAGWPEKPYAQMCGPLTSSTSSAGVGSILTVRCPLRNEMGVSWRELVDMRDLGFLLP